MDDALLDLILGRGSLNLGTPSGFGEPEMTQVVDNKMVGDTGFEPVTSTVCKRHKKKGKRKI
jgi:hypothetical protein